MDDPAVVSCLDDVLLKGRLVSPLAAVGLERIGNREAVGALISSLPNGDSDLDSIVRSTLRRIRGRTVDASVKAMINTALRE
jgi:hypothetical protein